MKITGIILAGGLSSRMGQNKSLVEINGMPMILHVYNKLLPQVSSVLISTNEKLAIINAMSIKPKSHEFNLNEKQPAVIRFMSHTGG